LANIPIGSLLFGGYGDTAMKFHSPAGVDLGVPATLPVAGAALGGLVALADGTIAAVGIKDPLSNAFGSFLNWGVFDSQLVTFSGSDDGPFLASIASNYATKFYGLLPCLSTGSVLIDGFQMRGNYKVLRLDGTTGHITATFDLGFNFFPNAGTIGVAPDESCAYYSKRSTASDPVRKCDLAGGFTTFATETGFSLFDNGILVLANGDVLVGWKKAGVNGFVKQYDASGALLHTYTLSGTNQAPLCLTPGLTSTSFWISFYAAGVVTASGVRVAEIEIGTGTILNSFDPDDGAGFEYDGPFCVVRVLIGEEEADPCTPVVDYEDPCLPDFEPWIAEEFVDASTSPATSTVYLSAGVLRPINDSIQAGSAFGAPKQAIAMLDVDEIRDQHFDVSGLACPFDTIADPEQHAGERHVFAPGAFSAAIKHRQARLFVDHRTLLELASQQTDTLELWEDERGLRFAANLETRLGGAIVDAIDRGLVKHVCIVTRDEEIVRFGLDVRIVKVGSFDLSFMVMNTPSYPSTSIVVSRERAQQRLWNKLCGLAGVTADWRSDTAPKE
jgi:HK97 family phage prohead protease